ncbi:Membrane protein of uncharacterised function (DUF340) [uncultured Ruminococcus sp.]|uniref:Lysine exporter LysO family protein n=1 Tax=Massiliimalia timonensis TaxID=1987501 RepID=A0A8J6PFY4_9FIRM|nr:lysine exporter LysO family protein [Massiliimalia timonensis]MBC8611746.1 lysine exporter LysO family protein [Massiliimalia timonensis]SCH48671.1 Membrane protein of uncharacterised function (DUF340) [uncultured Clostridium sp.]SCH57795.1 Membrane protein of uncharacterised function (DUF340) [uncultured Ruminococcus sp.]
MVYLAIVSLIAGVLCAQFIFTPEISDLLIRLSDLVLYVLMISVGISVGMNKVVLRKLKEYNLTVLLIPVGIIIGSAAGGGLAALVLQMPLSTCVPIVSGLGWYSLSGVLVGDLIGAEAGTIAFLSNLLREILSFLLIPFIVRHFGPYTAIAPAGATSEDTTLPMMIKYTSEDVVVISVMNGVICSACVPFLINLSYQLFR